MLITQKLRQLGLGALVAASFLGGNALAAMAEGPKHAEKAALPPGVNAVQNEMRELTLAMNEILLAVANNQLQAVMPAIHRVHTARQLTEQAIESGAYRLPKNADKMKAFIQEDDAFHGELVKLVKASRANDLQAATKQVGVIVNGCTSCHVKFRF